MKVAGSSTIQIHLGWFSLSRCNFDLRVVLTTLVLYKCASLWVWGHNQSFYEHHVIKLGKASVRTGASVRNISTARLRCFTWGPAPLYVPRLSRPSTPTCMQAGLAAATDGCCRWVPLQHVQPQIYFCNI
jgi:hypothetical protein